MLKREANEITGGLSAPGKMPEGAWSISAYDCNIGSVLRTIPNTVCSECYALKRRYVFPTVQEALVRRHEATKHPQWIEAMVTLITGKKHFRWFDSGDLEGDEMLQQILEVVRQTPETMHWLPTREYLVISRYLRNSGDTQPPNLCIRLSNQWIDGVAGEANNMETRGVYGDTVQPLNQLPWSVVQRNREYPEGYHCPAHSQGNQCGDCRACWDPNVKLIVYPAN